MHHRAILVFLSVLALIGLWSPVAQALPQTAGDPPTIDDVEDEAKVRVTVVPSRTIVKPGDQIALAVVFDQKPGWHVHTNAPVVPKSWGDFQAYATTIQTPPLVGATVGPIQWPRTKEVLVDLTGSGTPEPYAVFDGLAIAYVPVQIMPDASAGTMTFKVIVDYQACDDRICLLPETLEFEVPITVIGASDTPPPGAAAAGDAAIFKDFDLTVFGRADFGVAPATPSRGAVSFSVFGADFTVNSAGVVGLAVMLLLAALGGFLLNLTPCVLPVIPLKIMSLSQAAKNPGRTLLLGLVMSAGTVTFWLGIGTAIAFISGFTAINTLFQTPWFSIGVGLFIAVMGVGMLGLFTIQLPQKLYMLNPTHDSAVGSFLFGIMTAVLSTPCTAPFMGTAAAWATKQPWTVTLGVFAAIGAGMALPYLVLAARPQLLSRVPRSGPASDLVKQSMGILMFAVAAFFVGTGLDPLIREPIDPPTREHWWIVAALVAGAFAFIVYRGARIRLRPATLSVMAVVGLAASVAAFAFARAQNQKGPIAWVAYTPERFADRVRAGDVVVMDFTAEWCLNCKALEAAVLHRAEIAALLATPGVTPMKVDITGNNEPGKAKLKELKWVGIPLLAVFGPGLKEPLKFDTYTPEVVTDAVRRARGG